MPGPVPGIHVFDQSKQLGVDGRDKPGHDEFSAWGRERPGHDKSCPRRYIPAMTLSDLEKAVSKLPPEQLAKFRDWFDTFDAARFDEKIERDAESGRLERLAEQALADHTQGRSREL